MKYVMLHIVELEKDVPIIFPDFMNHIDIRNTYDRHIRKYHKFKNVKCVSAGFINLKGECHGKSETLDIESREKDSTIINSYDYFHGLF